MKMSFYWFLQYENKICAIIFAQHYRFKPPPFYATRKPFTIIVIYKKKKKNTDYNFLNNLIYK